jgi:hypothetical protein
MAQIRLRRDSCVIVSEHNIDEWPNAGLHVVLILRQIVRKMAVQIATEKSRGNTTITVPVHPAFADSLRAARAAGIIGAEVFTGKMVKGCYR